MLAGVVATDKVGETTTPTTVAQTAEATGGEEVAIEATTTVAAVGSMGSITVCASSMSVLVDC
jgi:hypothetical protein